MTTRLLGPGDEDLYRTVRLTALRTDPTAFASNHDREAAFAPEEWTARLAGSDERPGVVIVDESAADSSVTGMVGIRTSTEPGDAVLWGMWVRPEARGSGAATRLLDAAAGWATDQAIETITLWVRRTNAAAIRCYERHGYEPTGEVVAEPDDPCAAELVMRRRLRVVAGSRTEPATTPPPA